MSLFYVYLLTCADGSLYCGVAADLIRRLAEHNGEGGSRRGAKYTRSRRPATLAWSAPFSTRAAALKAEAAMKKLSRAAKLKIIAGGTFAPSLSSAPVAADKLKKSKVGSGKTAEKKSKVISRAAHRPSKAKKK